MLKQQLAQVSLAGSSSAGALGNPSLGEGPTSGGAPAGSTSLSSAVPPEASPELGDVISSSPVPTDAKQALELQPIATATAESSTPAQVTTVSGEIALEDTLNKSNAEGVGAAADATATTRNSCGAEGDGMVSEGGAPDRGGVRDGGMAEGSAPAPPVPEVVVKEKVVERVVVEEKASSNR